MRYELADGGLRTALDGPLDTILAVDPTCCGTYLSTVLLLGLVVNAAPRWS